MLYSLVNFHHWLAFSNQPPPVQRLVTSIVDLALFVLCLTSHWLWFTQRLSSLFHRLLL